MANKDLFELEFVRETSILIFSAWLEGCLYAYDELLGLNSDIIKKTFAVYKDGKANVYSQKGNLSIMKEGLEMKGEGFYNEVIDSYLASFKEFEESPSKILNGGFMRNLIGKFNLVFLLGDMPNNPSNLKALDARKITEKLFLLVNSFFESKGYGPMRTYEEISSKKEVSENVLESRRYSLINPVGVMPIKHAEEVTSYLKNQNIELYQRNEKSSEVEGSVASQGFAKGKVALVLSIDEIGKVVEGNILVTTMTSPDFVVVMDKIAALVTDEGGISSHAAIVSREFGIPCIVGTGNATRVFKDGDIVEVDAHNGIVKKVN